MTLSQIILKQLLLVNTIMNIKVTGDL